MMKTTHFSKIKPQKLKFFNASKPIANSFIVSANE